MNFTTDERQVFRPSGIMRAQQERERRQSAATVTLAVLVVCVLSAAVWLAVTLG